MLIAVSVEPRLSVEVDGFTAISYVCTVTKINNNLLKVMLLFLDVQEVTPNDQMPNHPYFTTAVLCYNRYKKTSA